MTKADKIKTSMIAIMSIIMIVYFASFMQSYENKKQCEMIIRLWEKTLQERKTPEEEVFIEGKLEELRNKCP